MLIYRFDPEVSVPVTQHGSDFRLGRLTDGPRAVSVQVLHLAPGGRVGRHPAASRQLFAVVGGSGWVSGRGGERRTLKVGYAALFAEGEEHEAGSEEGMTGVVVEGAFDVGCLAVSQEIVVQDYDPAWVEWFAEICRSVWPAVEGVALRIDHVGSTSVPGLAAKPIIDMDIVVPSESDVRTVIDRLATIGYRWRGDLGVVGRESFERAAGGGLPRHHLYLVVEDNRAHLDHWLLRDLLLADPEARERYGELKRRNVEVAAGDIDVYVGAKAELVAELLTRARAERGLEPVEYWLPG